MTGAAAKAWRVERGALGECRDEALLSASKVTLVYEMSTIPLDSEPAAIEIHNEGDTVFDAKLTDFYVPGFASGKGMRVTSTRIAQVRPGGATFRHTLFAGEEVFSGGTLADLLRSFWQIEPNAKHSFPISLSYKDAGGVEWEARFEIAHDSTEVAMRFLGRSRFPSQVTVQT